MNLRPLARLRDIFPIELQERNKRQLMRTPLELRINSKHRIVLSHLQDDEILLEVETPTNLRAGHGWGLITQLRLDLETIAAMQGYLLDVLGKVEEKSTIKVAS
jgi:hypothetical protein